MLEDDVRLLEMGLNLSKESFVPPRKARSTKSSDGIISKYRRFWGDDPSSILAKYKYQAVLTAKLDSLDPDSLDRETLYEIVLWKLNRFPDLDRSLLNDLGRVRKIRPKKHREAKDLLQRLLKCRGIRLPMASTILRFLNPTAFQIIDDRVYRIVYPKRKMYPDKPKKLSDRYLRDCERIYFDYLDTLHSLACPKLRFADADRILYVLSKAKGNKIGGR